LLSAENQYFCIWIIYFSVHFAVPYTLLPEASVPLALAPAP